MAELITNSNYQDFTLAMLQTPDGIAKLNSILSQLSANIAGDTESVKVYQGVGTPEASIAAGVGSIYMRTDGGADTSVYRKESGSADTGWVAVKAPATLPLSIANGGTGADFSSGVSGKFFYFSSTGVLGQFAPTLFPQNIQVFTSSGTWTKPTNVAQVYVKVIGGGGAGGTNGGGVTGGAGGGGGGGYAEGLIAVTGNVTVTIGATNSFAGAVTISATKGADGSAASGATAGDGGGGGLGSNGTINLTGQSGESGITILVSGAGGNTVLGSGAQMVKSGSAGLNGLAYGGGGSGGAGDSQVGGTGNGGAVIVYY